MFLETLRDNHFAKKDFSSDCEVQLKPSILKLLSEEIIQILSFVSG